MMNYKGWEIPEGKVVKVEDGAWRVIWMLPVAGAPVVLEVEKITSDTYAGETTYTGEEFILLDIYPKTNGTVNITYGGLTKTITDTSGAAEPNAQQVYFGTFNGVSDSVETPTSGTLTIRGDCRAFGWGFYAKDGGHKKSVSCCCVTAIKDSGDIDAIPDSAFKVSLYNGGNSTALKSVTIADSVKSIGMEAFSNCLGLEQMTIPKSVTSIAPNAFYYSSRGLNGTFLTIDENNANYSFNGGCIIRKVDNTVIFGFSDAVIPNGVTNIAEDAFYRHKEMSANFVIPNTVKVIGDEILHGADGITDLTIGSGVTDIGQGAFYGINTLARVIILATTPPTAPDTSSSILMFSDGKNLEKITVPKGCGAAYKSAPQWRRFADYIVEAS